MHFEAFACLRLSRRSRREPPGGVGRRASAPPFSTRKCWPRPVHACDPPSYMQPTESKRRKPDTFTKPSRSQTLAFALRFLKTRARDPCLTWPNGKSLQQRACAGIHNSHGRDPARHTGLAAPSRWPNASVVPASAPGCVRSADSCCWAAPCHTTGNKSRQHWNGAHG